MSTTAQHTPGESIRFSNDEPKANARLIAAAPDYHDGATDCVEYLDLIRQNYPDLPGLIRGLEKLKAAIAKATAPASCPA
jgi:hypothetical protein